ncbi:MAG: VOC family protein [Proteobacteria bacterium]|nr:VOC family protein [Pseudomonadota bacterium]
MEPAHVKRSAHCVFRSTDLKATNAWYNKYLGLAKTDDIYAGEKDNLLATFNHVDAGDEFVDHHTLLAVQSDSHAFNHLSFEVADFDDVQIGHEYLASKGKYKHAWGVGRHVLGSQIYDYWRDPWGRIHEHWTDSDMVNMDHKPGLHSTEEGLVSQWGPEFPGDSFLDDPENHAVQPIPA